MNNGRSFYAILGIENQNDIHYAMLVRNMLYDALAYSQQISALRHISRPTAELMRDYASLKRLPRKSKEGDYNMCKAIEDMKRKGMEMGIEKGIEITNLQNIKNVMESFHVDAERAMQSLKIPRSQHKKYLSML